MKVFGGHCWQLTGDLEDFCVEIFIRSVSKRGVIGGHLWFLTKKMDDMVILDIMDDAFLPQGTYPEIFMLIS